MALFGTKKPTTGKTTTVKKAAPETKKETAASMQDLYNTPVATKSSGKKVAIPGKVSTAYRILVKPQITEKATNLGAENKYVFIVAKSANKISIAKAIAATYGVKPINVNIINVIGKKVRRGRIQGVRSDFKKAIVTLAKGETIKIYEGV